MVIDGQCHMDATRSDPPDGQSREQWLKSRLKTYLRDPVIFRMVDRGETVTGRELSRTIVDYCDVRACLVLELLDRDQITIILAQYGPDDCTLEEAARRASISLPTAYRKRHAALQAIGRRYYDEPEWEMPRRNSAQISARRWIVGDLQNAGILPWLDD